MIISQTPLRVSFFGGGTDLPAYYRKQGGAVLSTGVDKYCYITVNRRFDHTLRISYSKTEICETVDEIQHPLVREALKITGIHQGVEITSMADIPAGTGMGSSSTFTVGLLNALFAFTGKHVPAEELARLACEIEIDRVGEPIGKQDQFAAAFGGLNTMAFQPDEFVSVDPIICPRETKAELNQCLMLFYTGITRKAGTILKDQQKRTEALIPTLEKMKAMVEEGRSILQDGRHLARFGTLLGEAWHLKRGLSQKISNGLVDDAYSAAIDAGALGGKLLGAGGGGFLLVYCERHLQKKVRENLKSLREIPFNLEPRGSRIIFVSE